jgi:ABC-type lipoprotein export system ATPase subunit
MIRLDKVSKSYTIARDNIVQAVNQVSLEVHPGEFVIITGRSGSGKTTLLNLAAGITRPTAGKVFMENIELWGLPDREQSLLRNKKVGFIFQFPSLLPSLTVHENVILPVMFGSNGLTAGQAHKHADELLERVGLTDKRAAYPRQLSAGQQQRVVIARALLNRPQILLADEPTSNLDEQTEREIMDLFKRIHKDTGITIVMVTHTNQLVRYGTRSISMTSGKISEDVSVNRE